MREETLNDEVKQIQDVITTANKRLDEEKLRYQALKDKKVKNQHRLDLLCRLDALRSEAVRVEKKWTMMKRISVWDLSEVNQQRTSLSYIGTCSEACATVSFFVNNTGALVCESAVCPSLYNNTHGRRNLPAAKCWQAQNESLCAAMTVSGQPMASFLKRKLRSNAWTRCRLEAICYELKLLHRRYDASIETINRQNGFKSFAVQVRFSRFGSQLELLSSFELTNAYPFGSLNTKIKQLNVAQSSTAHEINLDAFQEVLAKNARPGFCYLSRTVAVLSAYFHQEVAKEGVHGRGMK